MRDLMRRLEAAEKQLRLDGGSGDAGGDGCPECRGQRRLLEPGEPWPTCGRCGRAFDATLVTEFVVYSAGDEPEHPGDGRTLFCIPDNGRDALPPVDDLA